MLMKNLLPILVITSCEFSSYAQEDRFIAKDSNLVTELCVEAANNRKSGIKHVMRRLYGHLLQTFQPMTSIQNPPWRLWFR
jgi:hypothetical protein